MPHLISSCFSPIFVSAFDEPITFTGADMSALTNLVRTDDLPGIAT